MRPRPVVDEHLDELVSLSHFLHQTPELCFGETVSARAVAETMRAGGLEVAEGVYDLPTALESRSGGGDLVVAVCAEYDALPDVGHACGHNIIAATAVGAGLALAAVADDIGLAVRVLGTPAEEGGGGKILMLERGAFAGVHAAMMVHPWPTERLTGSCLAVAHFDVRYTRTRGPRVGRALGGRQRAGRADGRPGGHRPAAPAARPGGPGPRRRHPQLLGGQRHPRRHHGALHGPLPHRGGTRRAAAPGRTRASRRARSPPGARSRTRSWRRSTRTWRRTRPCSRAYRANAETLGRRFEADDAGAPLPTFSTDMANVSLAVPTIHPLIGIETHGAVNHQREFAAACVTPSADAAVRDGAVALAWTAIDAATDPELRERLLGA